MRGVKRGRDGEVAKSSLRDSDYADYLRLLKQLISHRSVTTDDGALHAVIDYCRRHFAAMLAPLGWSIDCDAAGNLCCIPPAIDTSRPVLWLNAHADTVDASPADFAGRDPFTCFESETHLIGRGANDCKAGVAFMMWYGEQMAKGRLPILNGGFLVTRREEAGSTLPRTAFQFAADLTSGQLPMSSLPRSTCIWILENTVSLATHLKLPVPEVAIYDRERHSLSLLVHGTLAALGLALLSIADHHEWKTVAIWPSELRADASDPSSVGALFVAASSCATARSGMAGDTDAERAAAGRAIASPSIAATPAIARRRLEAVELLERLGLPLAVLVQHTHEGGHSCTVPNAGNRIFQCLVDEAVAASERDGVQLPAAALPAWASTRSEGMVDGESSGNGDGVGASDVERHGTALLWSGLESQPTRVASSVTTLPRSALPRSPRDHITTLPSSALPPLGNSGELGADSPMQALHPPDQVHTLVLNYRGLKPLATLEAQIQLLADTLGRGSVEWSAGSDLHSGVGAQQHEFVSASGLPQIVESVVDSLQGSVTLKYEPNPGRSDASHLWRSLPDQLRGERVVPFTCGPGHRSHLCQEEKVMRKTHGPNEGFHKSTGRTTLPFFVELVRRFSLHE